jgi:DNA replication protein DnaC
MAFAKLSSALLACHDARPAPARVLPTPARVLPRPNVVPAASLVPAPAAAERAMRLAHHLRTLKLPAFLDAYHQLARECAAEGLDNTDFLLRLAQLEVAERQRQEVERRIREARFPAAKGLDGFDFSAIPALDERLIMDLARCEYIARHENIIAFGDSGTGKTHLAIGLGRAACEKGLPVGFATAASLAHELLEAHGERGLSRLMRRLSAFKLLIIDELGYVPLPAGGAELLFEVFSRRYECGATIVTSHLPIEEWGGVFGHGRAAAALLDRMTHRVHLLDMRGESYRARHAGGHPPHRSVATPEKRAV